MKRKYISKGYLLLMYITIEEKCDDFVINFLINYGKYLKEM